MLIKFLVNRARGDWGVHASSLAVKIDPNTGWHLMRRLLLTLLSTGLCAVLMLLSLSLRAEEAAQSAVPIRVGWQIPGSRMRNQLSVKNIRAINVRFWPLAETHGSFI